MDCFRKSRNIKTRNKISRRTIQKILRRAFSNWKCPFCGWTETFEVHHIIPRCEGGSDELSNLVMLCPNHHSLADLGKIGKDVLREFSISQYYTEEELLNEYYEGEVKQFEIFRGDVPDSGL